MSKRQKPDQKQLFHSLAKDFREIVTNKQVLRSKIEHFLCNLIDEMTLGIIFDIHRKYKTNAYELETDDSPDEEDSSDVDIFAQHTLKKTQDCVCPNCEGAVAAARFAPHLEKCMGMGRLSRSRNATRRNASNSKDRGGEDSSTYSGIPSDDDDDVDWRCGSRKRNRKRDRNGKKKGKGVIKKMLDTDTVESLNVDVEGDDDELTNLRDLLHLQDNHLNQHSNSTSPADSASSSGSTKRKIMSDKSKKKNGNASTNGNSSKQREGNSPTGSNVSVD